MSDTIKAKVEEFADYLGGWMWGCVDEGVTEFRDDPENMEELRALLREVARDAWDAACHARAWGKSHRADVLEDYLRSRGLEEVSGE